MLTMTSQILKSQENTKEVKNYETVIIKKQNNNINNVLWLTVFTRQRTKTLCLYLNDCWEFK
jgi:hypothetical protein